MISQGGFGMKLHEKVSTDMAGFDKTIDMLRMGDNVVWQIADSDLMKEDRGMPKSLFFIMDYREADRLREVISSRIW